MKALVVYESMFGNTRLVARAISHALPVTSSAT
jgi:flavodoxin